MAIAEPFFFGPDERLFGMYHTAQGAPKREAVLIAEPLLNESMRSHFATRQIAIRLAKRGYDTMRFDYSGMGNSLLKPTRVTLADWQDDIIAAFNEVIDISGATSVSLVGVRFSAALLIPLCSDSKVKRLITWDPLIHGSQWLSSLRLSQQAARKKTPLAIPDFNKVFSGHEVNSSFVADIGAKVTQWPQSTESVAIVSTESPLSMTEFPDYVRRIEIGFPCSWESMSSQVLYPHEIIDEVCRLI